MRNCAQLLRLVQLAVEYLTHLRNAHALLLLHYDAAATAAERFVSPGGGGGQAPFPPRREEAFSFSLEGPPPLCLAGREGRVYLFPRRVLHTPASHGSGCNPARPRD